MFGAHRHHLELDLNEAIVVKAAATAAAAATILWRLNGDQRSLCILNSVTLAKTGSREADFTGICQFMPYIV